jgi:hypothetical protein
MFAASFFQALYWVGITLTVVGISILVGLFIADIRRRSLW